MSKFALGKEMNIEVSARLIARGADEPLTGNQYRVRLFDKDFFDDDFLGESGLDGNGKIHISFSPSEFEKRDPIKETSLDFYFVLFRDGKEIFRSKVMDDVDVEAVEAFRMGKGEMIDLGTFLVDA